MKKNIYCVSRKTLTNDELALFTCLQGLVNKKTPELILDVDHYLEFVDENLYRINHLSFKEVIDKYFSITDKYVLYELSETSTQINAAFSYSAVTDALAVPKVLENLVKGKLTLLEDLSLLNLDNLAIQKYVFNKFKDKFNKNGLIHEPLPGKGCEFLISLRDFAITNKWFVLYVDESKEQRQFLDEVLSFLDKGICIYGWTSDEISFVNQISKYGDAIIPMDWSSNHSFFGTFTPKKVTRKHHFEEVKPDKHYISLVVSDGDNIQWLERDFCFSSFYLDYAKTKRDYPLTVSLSPALIDLNPMCLNYIYSHSTNEDFIPGVSGYGYMNPCVFPKEFLASYAKKTSDYLSLLDVNVVMLLDNLADMSDENVAFVLDKYAKYDNIIGGVYEIDPTKYEGGKGRVYFSNNKPFVSVKISLWNIYDNEEEIEKNKDKLIHDVASFINSQIVSPTTVDGYSVINIHPWSTSCLDVDKLVNLLSDKIQILGIEQLLLLMRKNIKHH